jgi:hypothetical protein
MLAFSTSLFVQRNPIDPVSVIIIIIHIGIINLLLRLQQKSAGVLKKILMNYDVMRH